MNIAHRPNRDLKEDIRAYWSDRSKTFDLDFGHKIADGPEFQAWAAAIRAYLGERPLKVLELACGTGEITRVLLSLGHEVKALDFSEAMLDIARSKHRGDARASFILADAENTMEPDGMYDAIVCRHLVWTLTEPAQAFADWHRVLKPGGRLVFFDGNWARPTILGKIASWFLGLGQRARDRDAHSVEAMAGRHSAIMQRLPFGSGLTGKAVVPMLENAGFAGVTLSSHAAVTRGQRKNATLRNKLRTFVYLKFVISARKQN